MGSSSGSILDLILGLIGGGSSSGGGGGLLPGIIGGLLGL